MSYEDGDRVVLHDEHSEHDGAAGTVSQVMETMFGDETYTVQFEDGQETGLSADQLEPATEEPEADEEDAEA
jgi:hypothetical protein